MIVKNKKFSKEDDEIIRKYYPQGGSTECVKHLPDRASYSIVRRANWIGVKFVGDKYWNGLGNSNDRSIKLYKDSPELYQKRSERYLGSYPNQPNKH